MTASWVRSWLSRQKLWYAPSLVEMSLIWTFSAMSHPPEVLGGIDSDKLLHAGAYALLALLLWGGLVLGSGVAARRASVCAVLISVVYGALDEFHQGYVPGRDRDIADLAADAVGAGAAMLLVSGARRWIRDRMDREVTRD